MRFKNLHMEGLALAVFEVMDPVVAICPRKRSENPCMTRDKTLPEFDSDPLGVDSVTHHIGFVGGINSCCKKYKLAYPVLMRRLFLLTQIHKLDSFTGS